MCVCVCVRVLVRVCVCGHTYSGKTLTAIMFGESEWIKIVVKKVWQINRLAKGLLSITTDLESVV